MTPKDIATVKAALEYFKHRVMVDDWNKPSREQHLEVIKAAARAYVETALSSPPAAPTPDNNGWIPTHRHIKTGGLYQVIGAGKLRTDEPLSDNCHMILYRGEDGRLWARSNYEFEDTDRFEPLPPPPALDKGE